MNLIIVSGPEATGKTAIGRALAKLLSYQYLSKDMIKEALFDSEQHSTWDYSWYEERAKTIFFGKIADFIAHNESVVIESNFVGADKEHLVACLNDKVLVTEIYCRTTGLTSFMRFVRRNENGTRHKGHHDRRWYLQVLLQGMFGFFHIQWLHKPTGISEKLLIVDSTDFSKVDYDKIISFINQASV